MILQALNELYDRLADDPAYEIAKPGHSPQTISFRIVLRPDGKFHSIEQGARLTEGRRSFFQKLLVPGNGQRSGLKPKPFFGWDNALYLLGLPPKGRTKEWADERRVSSRDLHIESLKDSDDPLHKAVVSFFQSDPPSEDVLAPWADCLAYYGTFKLQGQKEDLFTTISGASFQNEKKVVNPVVSYCLVSGKKLPIARLHPVIKGLTPPKGKQQQDGPLVSIDSGKNAFASFGKEQSFNAPVSEEVAFRYGTALNSLLTGPRSRKHRIRIGDATTVFWTEKPTLVEDLFADIFSGGSQAIEEAQDVTRRAQLQQLLEAIRSGGCYEEHGESQTPFYILGLAPNAARISIRFFHRSTIADLVAKLHDHHDCMKMVRSANDPEFPSIRQILSQIRVLHRSEEDGAVTWKEGKDGSDKFISMIGGGLARSIVEGVAYPDALFSAVIRRSVIERRISYLRASTLKGILTRNHKFTIPVMLDPQNTHAAYLHGRLFAVLEKIQEEGHYAQTKQRLKSSIKEKYFSSACATPAAVFPRLETLSVHHQRHLNPGRKVQFDKLIAEIKWPLSGTKKTHSLVEQGVFILGYYHQRKALFQGDPSEELEMAAELDPA